MGVLKKLGILIVGCHVAIVAVYGYGMIEPYSTETVIESVWDEYEVQSTQIVGGTVPMISVDVYDEDDIKEVENYFKRHLTKADLEYYQLDVFLHVPLEELQRKYLDSDSDE